MSAEDQQVTLLQILARETPRERGGSITANRRTYQDDWALCKILELFEGGDDFVLILDYHEDVVVLNSDSDPGSIFFYQIKTKKWNSWKRTDLTKRSKGKNGKLPSILGKLYSNYETFATATRELNFVSNVGYDMDLGVPVPRGGLRRIRFDQLHDDVREKIGVALKDEIDATEAPPGLALICFETTDLSVDDHVNHSLGKLTAFLEKIPEIQTQFSAAFFRALKDQIGRVSQNEYFVDSAVELCRTKAISRADFLGMLSNLHGPFSDTNWPKFLEDQLRAEGAPLAAILKLPREVQRVIIDRIDQTNAIVHGAIELVQKRLTVAPPQSQLVHMVDGLYQISKTDLADIIASHGESYLRALIALVCCEYNLQELPSPDSQPSPQAK